MKEICRDCTNFIRSISICAQDMKSCWFDKECRFTPSKFKESKSE